MFICVYLFLFTYVCERVCECVCVRFLICRALIHRYFSINYCDSFTFHLLLIKPYYRFSCDSRLVNDIKHTDTQLNICHQLLNPRHLDRNYPLACSLALAVREVGVTFELKIIYCYVVSSLPTSHNPPLSPLVYICSSSSR